MSRNYLLIFYIIDRTLATDKYIVSITNRPISDEIKH